MTATASPGVHDGGRVRVLPTATPRAMAASRTLTPGTTADTAHAVATAAATSIGQARQGERATSASRGSSAGGSIAGSTRTGWGPLTRDASPGRARR